MQKLRKDMPEIYTIERAGIEFASPYNEAAVAAILGSVPTNHRHALTVTEWHGEVFDPDEPGVEYHGDHWFDSFLSYTNDPVYCEGSRVFIGERFKVPKHQKRVCVVDTVHPEYGRNYAILRGIGKRGISRANSQVRYWHLNELWLLEWLGTYDHRYIPKNDPSGLIHTGPDWRGDLFDFGRK